MHSPPAQMASKLGPGPMQPGSDGADGSSDRLTNFLVRQVLLVKEGEDQPVLRPQQVERTFDFAREVVGISACGAVIDPLVDGLGQGEAPPAPGAGGPTPVRGDSDEPGSDRPVNIET